MANIEPGLPCAIIGEGAAVRLGAEAGQDASETHVYFEPCEENKAVTVAESQHNEDGAGRVLDVNLLLRNVCPGKRIAVGITLHEVDGMGGEHARGLSRHDRARPRRLSAGRRSAPDTLRPAGGTCASRAQTARAAAGDTL